MLALNSAISQSTGKSAHQLLYGEDVPLPVDHVLEGSRVNVTAEEAATRAVEWAALAKRAIQRASERQAAYVNRKREDVTFQEGDQVLLSSRHLPLEGTRKLAQRWMGPFPIVRRVGDVAYRLQLPP